MISSFSISEHRYTGPLGRGASGVISIGCLTWQCVNTPVDEAKMSLYSSMIPSTYLCCKERVCVEAIDVVATF
jgi:hypothetical protein